MAWTDSGVVSYYVYAMGTNAVKVTTDGFKVALFGSGVSPTQSASVTVSEYGGAGSTWDTTNEVSSSNYIAGGASVSGVSWTQNYNSQGNNVVTMASSASPSWSTVTFTSYGAFVYDTTTALTNLGLSWNYFGGSQQVTSGTSNFQGVAA
jgi:hypothetical protein